MLDLPNLVTLTRLALTPLAVWAILQGRFGRALAIVAVAGATDVLDGLLARWLHSVTRLGAYLDPVADKVLLSATYLALGAAGAVPLWVVLVVFGRDVLILALAAAALLFTSHRSFPPSVWGKISTLFQIVAAITVLTAGAFPHWKVPVQWPLWAAAAATVWSGLVYVWRGISLVRRRAAAQMGSDKGLQNGG
ncbi:MAG: CDP-alcohol phosphatidyltransferase family protein [Bryobacteraceae bacterium]